MEPERLSASALKTYEDCPAAFKAFYVDRATTPSGVAADLGTAAHEALMKWTVEDHMDFDLKLLLDRFDIEAARLSLPDEQCKQGRKMLEGCFRRLEDNPPYVVLQAEIKERLEIPLGKGVAPMPFTYIYDRLDQHEDGALEVVDYKSWFQALDPATAYRLVQVRMYALCAAIKYKDLNPPEIWVTLDQLRYGTISVKFTRDDIREIYQYFKDVVARIRADDGTEERINPNCRYCVRKDSCETFQRVISVNPEGVLATDSFDEIGHRLAELYEAKKALELMMEEYEDWLDSYLEQHRIPEATTESGVVVKYSPTSRRKINHYEAALVVGEELAQRYGKFTMEDIDNLLKGDELTDAQKRKIEKLIETNISTRVSARFKKN